MSIGTTAGGASAPAEWCVHVSVSCLRIVPKPVLNAWLACEAYQRDNATFWPDNRALCAGMGLASTASVQRALLRLEDLGVLERIDHGGNRRTMRLRRRASELLTPAAWSQLEAEAVARVIARTADGRRRTPA